MSVLLVYVTIRLRPLVPHPVYRPTPVVLDEGDVGSDSRYVDEKQDHGFSFDSPHQTAQDRLLDSCNRVKQ